MSFLPALLYALLINGVPLIAVIWTGGSPAILVLLYWFETVALVITGAIRILVHRRATGKAGHHIPTTATADHNAGAEDARQAIADENTYLRGFVGINAIFTIAHGVFVVALVFLFKAVGPVTWEEARVALYYVIAVQGLFLLWDMPRIAGWSFTDLQTRVGSTSIRVLVTQLGLIFGFLVAGFAGPWGLVGTFVVLRALADAAISWVQGLLKQRDLPPGVARFLARKGKQTAEEIEAEFDDLKAKGAEVEQLLELPIDEARTPHPRR
ncbi:MAG: hypothetical protein IT518_16385 [Burkholderiales bacterium]|nr:hypothetical protein [Burkholderiales bacterium]